MIKWILVFFGLVLVAGVALTPNTNHGHQGFEGDLIAVHGQIKQHYGEQVATELETLGILENDDESFINKTDTAFEYNRWPKRNDDGMAVVSYQYDSSFSGTKTMVDQALREIENVTRVLKFEESIQAPVVRLTSHSVKHEQSLKEYLKELYVFDCWSYVGYQGAMEQELNLGQACQAKGFIQHVFLHTLGLWHESSRYDRDEYIQILWNNVWPGLEYDLHKRIVDDTLETPYDYASIMHDDRQDFANLQKGDSMVAPEPIGQLDALSDGDVIKLRLLYQCESGPRILSDYMQYPCTNDCKCWEAALGCDENDEACQGELICILNRCVHPSQQQEPMSSWRIIGIVIMLACLILGLYYFRHRRSGYEALR